MSGFNQAKRILERISERPSPEEVLGLGLGDIDRAAEELKYPVYDLGPFFVLQKSALGLLENKLKKLFSEHEESKPTYLVFGRDGAMIYDALFTVAMKENLVERIKLVTLSKPQADEWRREADLTKKNKIRDGILWYLAQESITSESLAKGNFVFIDSGNVGSMFNFVLEICGTSREAMGNRLAGYLISRADASPYKELGWWAEPQDEGFFRGFYREFVKNWDDLEDWPVNVDEMYLWGSAKKLNWALASYLHIQPKYHRRTAVVEKVGERWMSLPKEKDRRYPLCDKEPWEPSNITEPIWHPNHSTAIDPVASTKLQIMTVQYFSQPEARRNVLRV